MKIFWFSLFQMLPLLLCSSLYRGWDQDRSSETPLAGETAADAVHAAWPETIHQVFKFFILWQLYHPCCPYSISCVCHWILHHTYPHVIDLYGVFTFFLWSHFFWTSMYHLSFLLCHFVLLVSFFPLYSSLHPSIHSVSADLLLLRPNCQDHSDQLSTTWQHLSSCCIRLSSEHPLSSCLLFAVDGASCVCASDSCSNF